MKTQQSSSASSPLSHQSKKRSLVEDEDSAASNHGTRTAETGRARRTKQPRILRNPMMTPSTPAITSNNDSTDESSQPQWKPINIVSSAAKPTLARPLPPTSTARVATTPTTESVWIHPEMDKHKISNSIHAGTQSDPSNLVGAPPPPPSHQAASSSVRTGHHHYDCLSALHKSSSTITLQSSSSSSSNSSSSSVTEEEETDRNDPDLTRLDNWNDSFASPENEKQQKHSEQQQQLQQKLPLEIPKTSNKLRWRTILGIILGGLFFSVASATLSIGRPSHPVTVEALNRLFRPYHHHHNHHHHPNSVYVPGGGFSGFWFTLGRLQSIPNKHDMEYYCYSAGCLGVVAILSDYTMEDMWNMAHGVQVQWQRGEISRYQVVTNFLDELLLSQSSAELVNETTHSQHRRHRISQRSDQWWNQSSGILSKLHIITSTRGGWFFGMQPAVRTPTSLDELHEMLLQTTWIPGAVGAGLWHRDHMDGAFTTLLHPSCTHQVGLAVNLDLFANVVNVNLSRKAVERFWQLGLEYGL